MLVAERSLLRILRVLCILRPMVGRCHVCGSPFVPGDAQHCYVCNSDHERHEPTTPQLFPLHADWIFSASVGAGLAMGLAGLFTYLQWHSPNVLPTLSLPIPAADAAPSGSSAEPELPTADGVDRASVPEPPTMGMESAASPKPRTSAHELDDDEFDDPSLEDDDVRDDQVGPGVPP